MNIRIGKRRGLIFMWSHEKLKVKAKCRLQNANVEEILGANEERHWKSSYLSKEAVFNLENSLLLWHIHVRGGKLFRIDDSKSQYLPTRKSFWILKTFPMPSWWGGWELL
jgi:hypothetical protein